MFQGKKKLLKMFLNPFIIQMWKHFLVVEFCKNSLF